MCLPSSLDMVEIQCTYLQYIAMQYIVMYAIQPNNLNLLYGTRESTLLIVRGSHALDMHLMG